jgi:hypothetical protein
VRKAIRYGSEEFERMLFCYTGTRVRLSTLCNTSDKEDRLHSGREGPGKCGEIMQRSKNQGPGSGTWLGIPIFGSDFWDPHWKQNSNSVFNSGDSGWFFLNSAVEK